MGGVVGDHRADPPGDLTARHPRDGTAAIRVTISIGVAAPSPARRTLDDLLAAKRSGRDRVVIYADTRVPAQASRPQPLAHASALPG